MSWRALSPSYHKGISSHCRKSWDTREKTAKIPKSSLWTQPGCLWKRFYFYCYQRKGSNETLFSSRTSQWLKEIYSALTSKLLWCEPFVPVQLSAYILLLHFPWDFTSQTHFFNRWTCFPQVFVSFSPSPSISFSVGSFVLVFQILFSIRESQTHRMGEVGKDCNE